MSAVTYELTEAGLPRTMRPMPDDLLTVQQAARELGITDSRVRQLLIDGELKGEKFGHIWMIRRADVDAYERRKPGPQPKNQPPK